MDILDAAQVCIVMWQRDRSSRMRIFPSVVDLRRVKGLISRKISLSLQSWLLLERVTPKFLQPWLAPLSPRYSMTYDDQEQAAECPLTNVCKVSYSRRRWTCRSGKLHFPPEPWRWRPESGPYTGSDARSWWRWSWPETVEVCCRTPLICVGKKLRHRFDAVLVLSLHYCFAMKAWDLMTILLAKSILTG